MPPKRRPRPEEYSDGEPVVRGRGRPKVGKGIKDIVLMLQQCASPQYILLKQIRELANSLFRKYSTDLDDARIVQAAEALVVTHDLVANDRFFENFIRELAISSTALQKAREVHFLIGEEGLADTWRFPTGKTWAMQSCVTAIHTLCTAGGRRSFVMGLNSYPGLCERIASLGGYSEIARYIRLIVTGRPLPIPRSLGREYASAVIHEITKISFLLMGIETIRNPASLIHNSMVLDLVENDIISWEMALNLYKSKPSKEGGLSPMSMDDAVASSRFLDAILIGDTETFDASQAKILMDREADITRLWLCYKSGQIHMSRAYAGNHNDARLKGSCEIAYFINTTVGTFYNGGQIVSDRVSKALDEWYGVSHYDIPDNVPNHTPVPIEPDGNCMYNAIIAAVQDDTLIGILGADREQWMRELRRLVARRLLTMLNGPTAETIIANILATIHHHPEYHGNSDYDAINFYLDTIIEAPGPYNWGDHVALNAAAQVLGIQIHIHHETFADTIINAGPAIVAHLFLHGEAHYDAYAPPPDPPEGVHVPEIAPEDVVLPESALPTSEIHLTEAIRLINNWCTIWSQYSLTDRSTRILMCMVWRKSK